MVLCPCCKKEIDFFKDEIWINSNGYKVKILDYGTEDIWLLYIENQNKVAWSIKRFLEEYIKEQS